MFITTIIFTKNISKNDINDIFGVCISNNHLSISNKKCIFELNPVYKDKFEKIIKTIKIKSFKIENDDSIKFIKTSTNNINEDDIDVDIMTNYKQAVICSWNHFDSKISSCDVIKISNCAPPKFRSKLPKINNNKLFIHVAGLYLVEFENKEHTYIYAF